MDSSLSWITFSFPSIPSVRCAFQTRQNGNSTQAYAHGNISLEVGDIPQHAITNRRAIAPSLGLCHWAECKQVHGRIFHIEPQAQNPEHAPRIEGDGFATSKTGHGLLIKTADCQPILLAHQSGKHVAALHVGWRGNRIGFIGSAITAFCQHYGVPSYELMAVRGPSLGPAKAEFTNFDHEWGDDFRQWFTEQTATVDLWNMTRYQLIEAGILPKNIFSLDLCTYSLKEDFFSYRRERVTGRQANIIWITKE